MTVLLKNKRQAFKVRLVFWFLAIVALLAIAGGWAIFQSYGLGAADGGVLKPFWERVAFGGFVGLFGILCATGMWLYMSLYVIRLAREGDQVEFTTLSPFGQSKQVFPVSAMASKTDHDGHLRTTKFDINAPWISLRVQGRLFPFILDMQSDFVDKKRISKLVTQR